MLRLDINISKTGWTVLNIGLNEQEISLIGSNSENYSI